MTQHPLAFRLAAGALAAWLALLLVDAPALHPCPMHDVPPAAAASAPAPAESVGGQAAAGPTALASAAPMAGMVMPGGAVGAPVSGAHPAHVHGCTCLGACAAGLVALVPPMTPAIAGEPLPLTVPPVPAKPAPRRPSATHLLPFAHAPPPLA